MRVFVEAVSLALNIHAPVVPCTPRNSKFTSQP